MNERGGTDTSGIPGTSPGAPAPGWYHDDHGLVRWWDGSGWTEHVQMPEQVAQPAGAAEAARAAQSAQAAQSTQADEVPLAPGFAPTLVPTPDEVGSGGPSYVPWIIALVSVLALCVASLLILKGLGDDGGNETEAIPSDDIADVQAGLSTAQTAIETYAVDHNGSYQGATPEQLEAIDGTLANIPLTVSGTASGYVLSAAAGEVTFSITRAESGVVTYACTPPGGDGCDENGSWGQPAIAGLPPDLQRWRPAA